MSEQTISTADLSPEAAAALRGVSLPTFYRMCARGEAPAGTKVGNTLRFRRDEILAWIELTPKVLRGGRLVDVRAGVPAQTQTR